MTTVEHLRSYVHLNGFVPSVSLAALCYAILLLARASVWGFAVIALPGTIAHELSHFLVGLMLRAKPTGFSLWPTRSANGWTLGSVSFRRLGLLNGAFVALAPVLLFPLGWFSLVHVAMPAWAAGYWATWLLAGYLTATVFFAGVPSFQDIKLGGPSLVVYLALFALCWWTIPILRSWFQ